MSAEPETYRAELERSDVVIHTMLDKKQPLETDRALFAALRDAAAADVSRRFIYTTGCSIFGKLPIPIMDERTEPNPDHPLAFRRELEREALALRNVSTVVLRPGFMFGNDGYNSVSADWFEMAEEGDPGLSRRSRKGVVLDSHRRFGRSLSAGGRGRRQHRQRRNFPSCR